LTENKPYQVANKPRWSNCW